MERSVFNVINFGANGNSKTLNTQLIQKAIDACSQSGGGTVYFPPGDFLSGTLHLRSNVTLYLEAGATLRASKHKKDYAFFPTKGTPLSESYFLYGKNLKNVTIEGRGTIEGQGPAFWTRKMINHVVWGPKEYRPRGFIYLVECENILFRDITIHDSPCFTIWLLGCNNADIRGLTILNHRKGPNTDALDIDCSSNVRISDCHIDAGDDCVALKSDACRLGFKKACENITVTNCTFSCSACAIRVGYEGDSPIRNCVFDNLIIHNTDIGIDIVTIVLDKTKHEVINIYEGPEIERILFSNIVMTDVNRPIFLWQGKEGNAKLKGRMENIAIRNLIASGTNGSFIGGLPEKPIRGVELSHVKLIARGNMKTDVVATPWVWGCEPTPCGLHAKFVNGLKLHDVQVEWEKASGKWQNALRCEDVENIDLDGLQAKPFHEKSNIPAVHLDRFKGLSVRR